MTHDSTSNRPPLTLSNNITYGVGSIAFGVHQAILTSGLMPFFNQVVGLPAAWVVTLIFDAICDPLIGEWSDHTRSRWGRRHPFMYASAVPAAIAFYFLFDPPLDWPKSYLLVYIAAMLVTDGEVGANWKRLDTGSAMVLGILARHASHREVRAGSVRHNSVLRWRRFTTNTRTPSGRITP